MARPNRFRGFWRADWRVDRFSGSRFRSLSQKRVTRHAPGTCCLSGFTDASASLLEDSLSPSSSPLNMTSRSS